MVALTPQQHLRLNKKYMAQEAKKTDNRKSIGAAIITIITTARLESIWRSTILIGDMALTVGLSVG
jgi:hypothetical protein